MVENKRKSFWMGFFLALAGGVLVWYWQKSTSADEGALDLLDELAKVRANMREIQSSEKMEETAVAPPAQSTKAAPADDLTVINGIGPVYARRLQEAGIATFADLAAQDPERLSQIVQLKAWQAASPAQWIEQAQELSTL